MKKFEFFINQNGKLNDALFEFGLKYSDILKLYKNKDIKVNGKRVSNNLDVVACQKIEFYLEDKRSLSLDLYNKNCNETDINNKDKTTFQNDLNINALSKNNTSKAQSLKFEIVYQDENIFIINKFAGIEVTGEKGLEGFVKGSIAVHRLDRDTKGLVIMARNKIAEEKLLIAFKNKQITKKYVCEVNGDSNFDGHIYEAYLVKDSKKSIVKIFSKFKPNSVAIKTKFKTIKHGKATSLVDCELLTGKTHQIRAHLAFLGNAILGDDKYGDKNFNKLYKEKTQKLYCYYLKFNNMSEDLEYLNNKEFVLLPNWVNKSLFKNVLSQGIVK